MMTSAMFIAAAASVLLMLTFIGWAMECRARQLDKPFSLRGCVLSTGSAGLLAVFLVLAAFWPQREDIGALRRHKLQMDMLQMVHEDLGKLTLGE